MKHVFTPLIFLLLGFSCVAQTEAFQAKKARWDAPEFKKSFILRNNIKAIHVRCFKGVEEPRGSHNSGTVYEYDSKGNLHQVVELRKNDTSHISNFVYTERGILGWQVMNDKTWNKKYKKGFRFNRHKKVFQEKSYEMLYGNEVMLLSTKQYIYDDDSVLTAIQWKENNRLIKTHKYEYDNNYNLVSETFENGSGEIMKKVSYNYNAMGLIARVTNEQANMPLEEFVYDYNTNGQKTLVVWKAGGELKGKVAYTYDQTGTLAKLNREMYQNSDNKPALVCQVFEYEKFD